MRAVLHSALLLATAAALRPPPSWMQQRPVHAVRRLPAVRLAACPDQGPAASEPSPRAPSLTRSGRPGSVRGGVSSLLSALRVQNATACETRAVWGALVVAMRLHRRQLRSSGEPFVTHPIAVATILAQQGMDLSSVLTGLLHDTVEDTGASLGLLEGRFGPEVARLVDGVTKLTRLEMLKLQRREAAAPPPDGLATNAGSVCIGGGGGGRGGVSGGLSMLAGQQTRQVSRAQSDSENLRKLVLAMSSDIRILLVKLSDRLHNMRTLRYVASASARRRKARETLFIYAPLADRLGMQASRAAAESMRCAAAQAPQP